MSGPEGIETAGNFSGFDATLDRGSCEIDASELRDEVLAGLRVLGYAHITKPHTVEQFDMIAQLLGSITLRTDLTLTPNRRSIVYKPNEINLHQDNPTMNILGWYCVRQDEIDGSMRLLDVGDVADHFSRSELEIMTSVNVRCPDPDPSRHNPDKGLIAYFLWPLLTEKAVRTEVYYAPWLLVDSYNDQQQKALEKFADYLREKEERQVIEIRLKAGESLFIDNNRLLHGRGSIPQDSKRFLQRVWIKRQI